MSVEAGYVGNRGRRRVRGRRARRSTSTRRRSTAISQGVPFRPARSRSSTEFGWTQGIDYFCNCANNAYDSLQAKFNKQFSGTATRSRRTTRCSGPSARQRVLRDRSARTSGSVRQRPELRAGGTGTARTTSSCRSLPSCRSAAIGSTCPTSRRWWTRSSAAGSSTPITSCRAGCRSTSPTAMRARIATPGRTVST